nr:ABC transporter substrate-binding protein [Desulfosarcina cetonica]
MIDHFQSGQSAIDTRWRLIRSWRILLATLFVFSFCPPFLPQATAADTRIVRDMVGRQVRIPRMPQRIACLHGPSYEKIFALGGADRVVMAANLDLPWAHRLNPALDRIPIADTFAAPDVERLLHLNVDLVIYPPFQKQLNHLTAAGLPVAIAYDSKRRPTTLEAFIADYYTQIRFYGELLGGQAPAIADQYCAYADERIRRVTAITSTIPMAKRRGYSTSAGRSADPPARKPGTPRPIGW